MFLQSGAVPAAGEYSEDTSREIDCEIRRIIDEQYARAHSLLEQQQGVLRAAAASLLGKEVMTGEELKAIAARSSSQR